MTPRRSRRRVVADSFTKSIATGRAEFILDRARVRVLWNTAAMPKLETHIIGIPSWVDVMVETTEQREALMKFYSSLYGWTWDVGAASLVGFLW